MSAAAEKRSLLKELTDLAKAKGNISNQDILDAIDSGTISATARTNSANTSFRRQSSTNDSFTSALT